MANDSHDGERPDHHTHAPHDHHHDHARDHGHAHGLGHVHVSHEYLKTATFLAFAILVAELIGGLLGHSLALISDAGHMLTDTGSLAIAWYASSLAKRPPTSRLTFGYYRAGILAALANAVTLIIVSLWILYEAIMRFAHPQPVHGAVMFAVAAFGMAMNLLIAWRLSGGRENLNVRSAWLHVMGDAAASAAVIVGGVIIYFTGITWIDPLLSIGIAALVFLGTLQVLREATYILMEGAPTSMEPEAIAATLRSLPAVRGVHDLHVWSLDAERAALSCHLVLAREALDAAQEVVREAALLLEQEHGIMHSTIQVEDESHGYGDGLLCTQLVAASHVD